MAVPVPHFLCYTIHMPATNEKFTLNIEPLGDHLQVTIPELGITVQTTGTTRREAEQVAFRAIDEHLMSTRQRLRSSRTRCTTSPSAHTSSTQASGAATSLRQRH